MNRKTQIILAIGIFSTGVLFCVLMLLQPVTLTLDGVSTTLTGGAITSGSFLRTQGYQPAPDDRLAPPAWIPMLFTRQIHLTTSAHVDVFAQSSLITLESTERRPVNLLLEAGIRFFPNDSLIADGTSATINSILPAATKHILQYRPAQEVRFSDGNNEIRFFSSAATIGAALWEQDIEIGPGDVLTPSIDSPLNGTVSVTLKHGRTIRIEDDGRSIEIPSASETVGGVLLDAGLGLQGLDYSIPAETDPVPGNGSIQVIRVREEVQLSQTIIPNTIQYQADANTELDQQTIIDPGQVGLQITQVRVRFENGQEVFRQTDAEWVAREARPQIIGYGTKVVIRTTQVDGNTIEYWRAVTVYATSYSPCNSGVPECLHSTANGMTVEKGVVGVIRSWYNLMNGQQIYVPGYGTAVIADIGAGFAGKDWVDLGYSDSDYVPWHSTVTIYFLTPVPANIPWILP